MDKQHGERVRTSRRRTKSGNKYRFTQNSTKKYQNEKRLAMMEYMDSDSRNSPIMNRCLQEAYVPEWMTIGKTTLIQKDLLKGTAPNKYRLITRLPLMWKILTAQIREDIYYSLTSCGLFPKEQKGCRKGSIHRSTHPKWEQNQTEKSSYGLDRLQKSIWYGLAKLDNKLLKNVQNIIWSHKLYWENYENLWAELTAGGKS